MPLQIPVGSDSDAPLVSRGRFAALSDDMTVLDGRVDDCSRVAIPIGEENCTRPIDDVPDNDSSCPTRVFGRDRSIRQRVSRCAQKTFRRLILLGRQP